jgi:RNA recognition motif-containing protein
MEGQVNIYIGNLDFQFTDEDLKSLFEGYGEVATASIFRDKRTGKGKGSGFVKMPSEVEARAAIKGINGTKHRRRILVVKESIPGEAQVHAGPHKSNKSRASGRR